MEPHEVDWMEEFVNGLNEQNLDEDGMPVGVYAGMDPEILQYNDFQMDAHGKQSDGKVRVVFYCEECGNPDHLGEVIQHFLRKWRPNEFFTLGWSSSCSKPHPGQFNGGWMVVTEERIYGSSSYHSLSKMSDRLSKFGRLQVKQDG
jgi:hypothetical protein